MPTSVQKFLDNQTGLPTLWAAIGNKFVAKVDGKQLSTEDFTTALKTKLEGLDEAAMENQDAFANVKVGATTIAAGLEQDTIEFVQGANVTLTPNAGGKTVTIAATDTTYSEATTDAAGLLSAADKTKLDGIAAGAQVNQNAFAQITANGTTISAASASAAFEIAAGANVTVTGDAASNKVTIAATDTTYEPATTSVAGLMSAEDKTKLNQLVAASGEQNVIEVVKVNGVALEVTEEDKSVNVVVPTKTSDITNDSDFQTSTQVTAAINAAIATVYEYKGSVDTADQLPAEGAAVGDTYNIAAASDYGPAGMNVAWNGTAWDALGSSITIEAMTAQEIQEICK